MITGMFAPGHRLFHWLLLDEYSKQKHARLVEAISSTIANSWMYKFENLFEIDM